LEGKGGINRWNFRAVKLFYIILYIMPLYIFPNPWECTTPRMKVM
jgi:hypothetical protein